MTPEDYERIGYQEIDIKLHDMGDGTTAVLASWKEPGRVAGVKFRVASEFVRRMHGVGEARAAEEAEALRQQLHEARAKRARDTRERERETGELHDRIYAVRARARAAEDESDKLRERIESLIEQLADAERHWGDAVKRADAAALRLRAYEGQNRSE